MSQLNAKLLHCLETARCIHQRASCGEEISQFRVLTPLTECEDEKEVALALFERINPSEDRLQVEDLERRIVEVEGCETELMILKATVVELKGKAAADAYIGFNEFFEAFRAVPRVRGERVRWAASLGIDGILARLLPRGDAADGLSGLRKLNHVERNALVRTASAQLSASLQYLLHDAINKLQISMAVIERHTNNKFVADGMTMAEYATLVDFHRGPEALMGAPNPRIREGIEQARIIYQIARYSIHKSAHQYMDLNSKWSQSPHLHNLNSTQSVIFNSLGECSGPRQNFLGVLVIP